MLSKKNNVIKYALLFILSYVTFAAPLANENLDGLYVRSIEHILRMEPEEIDIGTAALIVAEQWSDMVHGRRYQTKLDEMAYEIQARLYKEGLENSYKAVQVINDYLFNELGFSSVKEASNPDDLFLHSVIDNRRGYCLSLSILYLAIGERLGLPLYGVVAPGHFFVRYEDGPIRFNIETTSNGGFANDEHYIEKFKVPGEDSLYMKNLSKRQTLGCLFNNFGNVYTNAGDIDAAHKALELAVEINPDLAESRINLGNIYLRKGRVDDAIYEYRRAIEINSADGKVYNNLGNAYLQKDWINDAMNAYEQAIKLDSNQVDAYINLAITYGRIDMYAKALMMLRQAEAIEPGRADIYVKRGDVYFEQENYDDALDEYEAAVSIQRDNAGAYLGMGRCYGKLEMVKNEIHSYQQALKFAPEMCAVRVNLGNAYFKQKDYNKAIKQYRQCVKIEPDNAVIYYNIGAAFSNMAKYGEAVPWYEHSISIDPQKSEPHYNLGIAYYKLEDYEKAYTHLMTAQRLGHEVDSSIIKAVKRKMN